MSIVGIGIDVVGLEDFGDILRRRGRRFIDRVFTTKEIASLEGVSDRRRLHGFAADFAAKEAAFKALGTGWSGELRWQDIELEDGKRIAVYGKFRKEAGARNVARIHASVTRGPSIVSALVVLET